MGIPRRAFNGTIADTLDRNMESFSRHREGAASVVFRKAFDSVSYDILLIQLKRAFGITGTFLYWIKSYLDGRQ